MLQHYREMACIVVSQEPVELKSRNRVINKYRDGSFSEEPAVQPAR